MDTLYTSQKEARKQEFNNVINSKSGSQPFVLFPLRLETCFRTSTTNDTIFNHNDYIDVLKDISNFHEHIVMSSKRAPKHISGKTFYKDIHNIQRKIKQLDMISPVLKTNLETLSQLAFTSYNFAQIDTDEHFRQKIEHTGRNIHGSITHIYTNQTSTPRPKPSIIGALEKINKKLGIVSNFDKTPHRAISRLSTLTSPLENVVDRDDVIISNLTVILKSKPAANNVQLYLNIGQRSFLINSNKATFDKTTGSYTLNIIPDSELILDDLVNNMIYLSLGTNRKWRPEGIKIYYTNKRQQTLYLEKNNLTWPDYQKYEKEIINLESEIGAYTPLKDDLHKRSRKTLEKMREAFEQLSKGIPLYAEEKQEINNLLTEIINNASKVRNNITNIYNPKQLESTPQQHGRRPYVNVPERVKNLATSTDGVQEYLELHQEALTVFYDVYCQKYIDGIAKIGQQAQEKLTENQLQPEQFLPAGIIAEAIKINMYLRQLKANINTNVQALNDLLENSKLKFVALYNHKLVFYTSEERSLCKQEIQTLKKIWEQLSPQQKSKISAASKADTWIPNLSEVYRKKIMNTGISLDKQLCVRIFPDDIFISQFRKPLNKEEYKDAKNFHVLWYIFSGNRILERSLWDSLVNKYGVHRASWLVRVFSKHMKRNIGTRPYNKFADSYLDKITDIINILNKLPNDYSEVPHGNIPAFGAISAELQSCITRIEGIEKEVKLCNSIPDVLCDQIKNKIKGIQQSSSLYNITNSSLPTAHPMIVNLWTAIIKTAKNFTQQLENFLALIEQKREDLNTIKNNYEKQRFNDNYFKKQDGTHGHNDLLQISDEDYEPSSTILPDRFVFIGKWNNGKKEDIITEYGRKVNPNLQLSFSDRDDGDLDPYLLNMGTGDVDVEGGLKWVFNYDEAVRNGMAITVPLSDDIYDNATFEYIYVLGVKDENAGKETLEDLLYSHIYTENALDLLEIGTPTNQLEANKSHYKYLSEQAQIDRRYQIEVSRYKINKQNKFEDNLKVGTVAKNLAENLLGLNEDNNGGAFSYLNSCELNTPRLSVKAIKHFLPDINKLPYTEFSNFNNLNNFIKALPNYINEYVFPRGFLPSLRVGDMPYGIMPVTDFSNLEFTYNETNIKKLYEFLNNLSVHWDNIVNEKVEDMESLKEQEDEDSQVRFMRMISTNPYSVSHRYLKMLKNKLLSKQFHFYGDYKNLDATHLANYTDMLSPENVKELELFSYFPTGDISSDARNLNNIAEKLDISTTELTDLIDLFSYRLDAWFLSLANHALKKRNAKNVYIGAYGWLFNLKRDWNSRQELDIYEQNKVVNDLQLKDTTSPIYEDTTSEGIMLAPSISHAVTAAVMHSAFAGSKKNHLPNKEQDNRLSINLSSGRMQRAMRVIDGVSNGLSVGAILGANLERGLHKAYKILGVEMDEFIYSLRQKYPLNIDSYSIDASDSNAQSMQGLNGASLLEDIFEKTKWYNNRTTTPLSELIEKNKNINDIAGKTFVGNQKRVFAGLVEQIADTYDAVNDLILSEGVYQLVKGNRTALSALMNKMEHNSLIARPEILDIPMRSISISHRLVVNFETCSADTKPEGWTSNALLALAEPSLNYFVGHLLGNGNHIGIWIKTTNDNIKFVSLNDLEVAPLEYLFFSANQFAFVEMLLAKYRIHQNYWLPMLEQVEAPANKDNKICITEQALFVDSLRKMVQSGMQLKASHFVHQSQQDEPADIAEYYKAEELLNRLDSIVNKLKGVKNALETKLVNIKNNLARSHSQKNNDFDLLLDKEHINQIGVETFKALIATLTEAYTCGVVDVPPTEVLFTQTIVEDNANLDKDAAKKQQNIYNNKKSIIEQALSVLQSLTNKLEQEEPLATLRTHWKQKDKSTNFDMLAFIEQCNQIAEKLLVKRFKLLPHLRLAKLDNEAKEQLKSQLVKGQYTNTSPHQMEDWLMDLAKVRKYAKDLHSVRINAMCTTGVKPLTPIQLPFNADTEWAGMAFSDEDKLEDKEATVLWDADALKNSLSNDTCVGFVVDAWIELIPKRRQNAGAVFHYDVPNAEPPQTILLAVSPQNGGYWSQKKLINILNETKRMATYRLVEPEMINDNKTLSRILPLTPLIDDVS